MKTTLAPKDETHLFSIDCDCGKRIVTHLRHWEKYKCPCTRVYMVLQYKKGGPLHLHRVLLENLKFSGEKPNE